MNHFAVAIGSSVRLYFCQPIEVEKVGVGLTAVYIKSRLVSLYQGGELFLSLPQRVLWLEGTLSIELPRRNHAAAILISRLKHHAVNWDDLVILKPEYVTHSNVLRSNIRCILMM